jgi:hypothetical protein
MEACDAAARAARDSYGKLIAILAARTGNIAAADSLAERRRTGQSGSLAAGGGAAPADRSGAARGRGESRWRPDLARHRGD